MRNVTKKSIYHQQNTESTKLESPEVVSQVSLPSRWQMLKNLVEATRDVIVDGAEARSESEVDTALGICAVCPHFIVNQWGGRCGRCGCKTSFKVKLRAWHCPIGKW
jgi:hypothetical protein